MYFEKLSDDVFLSIDFNKFLSEQTKKNIAVYLARCRKCPECEKKLNAVSNVIKHLCMMLQVLYERNITQKNILKLSSLEKSPPPYIIGVTGSVSSGKSYVAEEIRNILEIFNPLLKIRILSTDNFIYSNEELNKKDIFEQKGYTPGYNWTLLFNTLKKIKNNEEVKIPMYSQDKSDIDPKEKFELTNGCDILIIEGINLLKTTCNISVANLRKRIYNSCTPNNVCENLLLSDYLDYSIYIETSEENLKTWFYRRMLIKKGLWEKDNEHKELTKKTEQEFKNWALDDIWNNYNSPNLEYNIKPFRYRSNLILHKNINHQIKYLEFKL